MRKHRNILIIINEILELLKKEEELSIRQISIKVKSGRIVIVKALEYLTKWGLVRERKGTATKVTTRLFSLNKKLQK
jgi:predicted transcriptional regulator